MKAPEGAGPTLQAEGRMAALALFEEGNEKGIRRAALGLLIILILALVTIVLATGPEDLHAVWWTLPLGGLGAFRAIQIMRKPEKLARLPRKHSVDEIIAHGGEHLVTDLDPLVPAEARLVIQDALDSVRHQRGSRGVRSAGRVAGGVGTLGWLIGAIVALVVGEDPISALLCFAMAGAFGGLLAFMDRIDTRIGIAERILEERLLMLGPQKQGIYRLDDHAEAEVTESFAPPSELSGDQSRSAST